MANPVEVSCTANTFVKVTAPGGVSQGNIEIKNTQPSYLITYRVADDPAPTDDIGTVGFIRKRGISTTGDADLIDVYVKAKDTTGLVVVST